MRNKVLIVDDIELNREILSEILEDQFAPIEASNGLEAIEMVEKYGDEIAVILLDIVMPKLGGIETLKVFGERGWIDKIPVLIISGEQAVETERLCFELGVSDFVKKPFDNMLIKRRVGNTAELFIYKSSLEEKVEAQTVKLKEQNDKLKAQARKLKEQAEKLKQSKENIIDVMANLVEARNMETGLHVKHVKGYTKIMAETVMRLYPEYKLTPAKIKVIESASALHDIGKIMIPDNVILKPGRLDKDEFDLMKTHTTKGCGILDEVHGVWDASYAKVVREICRHHHEKFDGRGYPDGLVADEIPIAAQIVSVADVYDALINERCYKKAFPKDVAFNMIQGGECGQFNPKLMHCFEVARPQMEALKKR